MGQLSARVAGICLLHNQAYKTNPLNRIESYQKQNQKKKKKKTTNKPTKTKNPITKKKKKSTQAARRGVKLQKITLENVGISPLTTAYLQARRGKIHHMQQPTTVLSDACPCTIDACLCTSRDTWALCKTFVHIYINNIGYHSMSFAFYGTQLLVDLKIILSMEISFFFPENAKCSILCFRGSLQGLAHNFLPGQHSLRELLVANDQD